MCRDKDRRKEAHVANFLSNIPSRLNLVESHLHISSLRCEHDDIGVSFARPLQRLGQRLSLTGDSLPFPNPSQHKALVAHRQTFRRLEGLLELFRSGCTLPTRYLGPRKAAYDKGSDPRLINFIAELERLLKCFSARRLIPTLCL